MSKVSRAQTAQMLGEVPVFAGLSKRQLTAMAKETDQREFAVGDVLIKELDVGQRLIIIRSGTAEVTRRGIVERADGSGITQGTSRRIATIGPGDIVGELALIDGKPTSASVIAETPVEALVLYRTRFKELLKTMPDLYPRLLIGMAERIRFMTRQTDYLA